jgi:type IV pilus assembly protein PilA
LIELMVVVLIIGILMAIAIPTFLSLTGSAKKNSAEANITTAVQDAATVLTQGTTVVGTGANATTYTGFGGQSSDTVAVLHSVDTGLNFVAGNAPGTGSVGVTWLSPTQAYFTSIGTDNAYYYAYDNNGVVTYDIGTAATVAPTTAAAPAWGPNWAQATNI